MDAEHAARLDQANALRGAVLGALVGIAFLQWGVEPDPARYGAFVIPELQRAQRHATSHERAAELEEKATVLLEAAPDLYCACNEALEWFRRARLGTLEQMEEALGQEAPMVLLERALRRAGDHTGMQQAQNMCARCGRTFPKSEPLQPINDFWERVEAGDIVPSGECPECGGLCYLAPQGAS